LPVRGEVFADSDGSKFVFAVLLMEDDGTSAVGLSPDELARDTWMMEHILGLEACGVIDIDPEDFPHLPGKVAHELFEDGLTEVYVISSPFMKEEAA
jgi:hypothetical protein